jgi:hypothetical protein
MEVDALDPLGSGKQLPLDLARKSAHAIVKTSSNLLVSNPWLTLTSRRIFAIGTQRTRTSEKIGVQATEGSYEGEVVVIEGLEYLQLFKQ